MGLFILSLVLCSLNQASAYEIYRITTNSSDLCTVQPCLTLSQLAANSIHYLHSNTTLLLRFLPGTHYLSNVNLTLSGMDNFVIMSESSEATAQIECTNNSHIQFSQSQYVLITDLEFIGCGGNKVENVDEFVVRDVMFKGQEGSGAALELDAVAAAQIVNSTFLSNRKGSHRYFGDHRPFSDVIEFQKEFIGGVIISSKSTIDISHSKFKDNGANYGGVIFAQSHSCIHINGSVFINNTATDDGGVLYSSRSTITIKGSEFSSNSATNGGLIRSFDSNIRIETSEVGTNNAIVSLYGGSGGVLDSARDTITIEASEFYNNSAAYGGVVSCTLCPTVTIERSQFHNNSATVSIGGVLYSSFTSTITIVASEFHNNSAATRGGVLCSINNAISTESGLIMPSDHTVAIEGSEFVNNGAIDGGVLYLSNAGNVTIEESEFFSNHATRGAVIYATFTTIQYRLNLHIYNNSAERYAVVYLAYSEFRGSCIIFSNNSGSLVAFNSSITFTNHGQFVNNRPSQSATDDFQEGGALTLLQSDLFFDGECSLEYNCAENGGAVRATESKIYVRGNITIANNIASGNGGGVYLSTSELHYQQKNTLIFNNTAAHKGGGLHAVSSSIRATSSAIITKQLFKRLFEYTGARINFTENRAELGGGLSLEANTKLYILKDAPIIDTDIGATVIFFTANSADYHGGAMYVDDNTNSGICASNPKTECFFQVLTMHGIESSNLKTQSMYFSQNFANVSGSTLYGGLLDRCAVSQFAEVHSKYNNVNGVSYFMDTATGETSLLSSLPVQVCLCTSTEHNCTKQSSIAVKKGETFTIAIVAVDQIDQPVNATIQTSLHFTESGLAEGQLAREISAECTNLTFNVLSPHNSESLTLYASDGPCRDADLSIRTVEVYFLPCSCPIGLQVSKISTTNCTCECHSDIRQHMKQCDGSTGAIFKQPQSRAWISYINDTALTGYLVYPNCPFDYCSSTSPPVDLNQPDGADAQCAFNRSSLLCGSCRPGLSLSLGSSCCLPCPSYWPALLVVITIAAILAGIALITLLLVLNMTVAVGTLNGLIFYANIVYANKNILLPFQETNFVTVFVSWLNLEVGIDTCYFPGMDSYIKTWLQLAFPAYVILLVVSVIIISSYSTKFSNLIGKKDPVATLATLILLSYAKLLKICFRSLSVGILEYPDGSSAMLWLPDATIQYLSGKHIPLFIAAILIFLVGLVYTTLLFLWQWLLYLPEWRIFRWTRNPRIQTFIETYHAPYTPKHRYWTGLLLIVRIVLYVVANRNVSNDPTTALTAIIFTVCCLFALRLLFGNRIYRKWPLDVLETFFYMNSLSFAIFIWYSLSDPSKQKAAAYTSAIITFIILLLIIFYHVYTYTTVFSKVKTMNRRRVINKVFRLPSNPKPKPECRWSPPPDDDIHRFYELLDVIDRPVITDDYKAPLKQTPANPGLTHSVVEVHHPQLVSPYYPGAVPKLQIE